MKKILSIQFLCLLVSIGTTAFASAVHSVKVGLKPSKLEKDSSGLLLEVSAIFDSVGLPEHKQKIAQGLGSVLLESTSSLDKQDLDAQFDKDNMLFRFRIKQAAGVMASQKSFSACVAQWFNVQTNENKARFNKAYLISEDLETSNFVRSSIAGYFATHLTDCIKLSLAIPTEDIQYFTNVYVENKIKGKVQDERTKNLASIFDQSFGAFQLESDKNAKADLLAKTAQYFDSFAQIGLDQTANLDALEAGIVEQKPLTAAKLLALTLSGFMDSATLAQAFEAIEQGQKTPLAFDRSLNWVNRIYSQCAKEYLLDPEGKECLQKLTAKDFYWIEFSRAHTQFKFLVTL